MSGSARLLVVVVLLAIAVGAGAVYRCDRRAPVVDADPVLIGAGGATVEVRLSDEGSGLRELSAVLRHAEGEAPLLVHRFAGDLLRGGSAGLQGEIVDLPIDAQALRLREGDAFLELSVRDWSWSRFLRGNTTTVQIPAIVDLTPPRVSVSSGLTYVKRAGAAAVIYSVNEPTWRDGVQVGDAFYAGFPWPAPEGTPEEAAPERGPGQRVAIFAVPDDAPEGVPIRVLAEDRVGNAGTAAWDVRLQERRFREEKITLSQRFLDGKIPPLAQATGVAASDALAAFQEINSRIRAENERKIRGIVRETTPRRLWKGAFVQMRNTRVTSRFAERRRYWYQGQEVSRAVHYGYDLAATAGAPVAAANEGRVLYADDLGIYGSCVILDHGLGIASLYAHLSRIEVAPGDLVIRGQTVGISGQTGLAGGDHLHFAVLVGQTYVDPVEWWDRKWVEEHVEVRLFPPATGGSG